MGVLSVVVVVVVEEGGRTGNGGLPWKPPSVRYWFLAAAVFIGATAGWVGWFAWQWNLDSDSAQKSHQLLAVLVGAAVAGFVTKFLLDRAKRP
jgi:hypothetical protein